MSSDPSLPILSCNVDKSQIPSIDQKRMLAFINHFVINTVTFLNKFIENCETKFIEFEAKLQQVEASLIIVESKVASIPNVANGRKTSEQPSTDEPKATEENTAVKSDQGELEAGQEKTECDVSASVGTDTTDTPKGIRASEDARYRKYFKMVQFGVPHAAVKLKMENEGLDKNILDNPNALLEDGVASVTETE